MFLNLVRVFMLAFGLYLKCLTLKHFLNDFSVIVKFFKELLYFEARFMRELYTE